MMRIKKTSLKESQFPVGKTHISIFIDYVQIIHFIFSISTTPSEVEDTIADKFRSRTEKELLSAIFQYLDEMNLDLVFSSKLCGEIYLLGLPWVLKILLLLVVMEITIVNFESVILRQPLSYIHANCNYFEDFEDLKTCQFYWVSKMCLKKFRSSEIVAVLDKIGKRWNNYNIR